MCQGEIREWGGLEPEWGGGGGGKAVQLPWAGVGCSLCRGGSGGTAGALWVMQEGDLSPALRDNAAGDGAAGG